MKHILLLVALTIAVVSAQNLQASFSTQITAESFPTTSLLNFPFTFSVNVHNSVPSGQFLTVIATGSDGETTSASFVSGVTVASLALTPKKGNGDAYRISFNVTGSATLAYMPPPPIDFRVIDGSQMILPNGGFEYIFTGATVHEIPVYLGLPVPGDQPLVFTVTDEAGSAPITVVFGPGQIAGNFSYTAPAKAGLNRLVFSVNTLFQGHYLVPPSFNFDVIDIAPVTVYGAITTVRGNESIPVEIFLGAPVPEGDDYVLYAQSNSGFVVDIPFEAGEFYKVFMFKCPEGAVNGGEDVFSLSFFGGGSADPHFNEPPTVAYKCISAAPETQILVRSEPATAIFAGYSYTFSIDLQNAVPANGALTVAVNGDDQLITEVLFAAGESVKEVTLRPSDAGDLRLTFGISGPSASNYIAPAPTAVQVVRPASTFLLLVNATTTEPIGDVDTMTVACVVPLPREADVLKVEIANEAVAVPAETFFNKYNDQLATLNLETGNVLGTFEVTTSNSHPELYLNPPQFSVAVLDLAALPGSLAEAL